MTFRTLAWLAAVFVLASCGGGGGGGTANMSGGGPSGPGSSRQAPDTVVVGDVLFAAQGNLFRANSSCNGSICTATFQGESVTLDLRDTDPSGSTVTIADQRTRNGVQTGRVTGRVDDLRFDTFGVWGTHNAAIVGKGSTIIQGIAVEYAIPESLGFGSGTNPLSGSASWTGAMAGVKVGSSSLGAEVTSDAAMTVDLGASSLDLEFTNIAERFLGARSSDIRWQDVPMQQGSFQASGLDGRFYGSNHEESGGVFERNGIAGVFSLTRQ